ncbi:hypothetical protein ES332_A08G113000v1 [Gossypium tomentosum]|uniref:DUF659 domain-containing protein n=1 Tax=Gossypium tomentosum TaxID=34277 RepID=A0A5D2PG60_GOSTO|nr:hypothetical protein ES332_A08G113000v1 [Gossypium tomentosum]
MLATNELTLLWKQVELIEGAKFGGNKKFCCQYCGAVRAGSYTKVKAHLLKIANQGIEYATDKDRVDKECARAFYTIAIPFNFLTTTNFADYVPPTFDRLQMTLLTQERTHVDRLLLLIRDTWRKRGTFICLDGWSDLQQRPLINIMAASLSGSMFIMVVDSNDKTKDVEYIASLFIEGIEEIRVENIFSHIFWAHVVHCLNMALKAICQPFDKSSHYLECKWVKDLVVEVHKVNCFILNHNLSGFIFNRYSNVKLLKVVETRFASNIIVVEYLMKVKEALEKTMTDLEWKEFKVNGKSLVELNVMKIRDLLLSETWWDKIDFLLKEADKDGAILHLIYDKWDSMIEKIKEIIFYREDQDLIIGHSKFFDAIQKFLGKRLLDVKHLFPT